MDGMIIKGTSSSKNTIMNVEQKFWLLQKVLW